MEITWSLTNSTDHLGHFSRAKVSGLECKSIVLLQKKTTGCIQRSFLYRLGLT